MADRLIQTVLELVSVRQDRHMSGGNASAARYLEVNVIDEEDCAFR